MGKMLAENVREIQLHPHKMHLLFFSDCIIGWANEWEMLLTVIKQKNEAQGIITLHSCATSNVTLEKWI